MPDAGIGEAILISSLIGGAATIAGQTILKPKMLSIPDSGKDPGGVPSATQAQADAAAIRQRALQRRTLESFQIDAPAQAGTGTGIQIPT